MLFDIGAYKTHFAGRYSFMDGIFLEGKGSGGAVTAEGDVDHVFFVGDGDDVDHMGPVCFEPRQPAISLE